MIFLILNFPCFDLFFFIFFFKEKENIPLHPSYCIKEFLKYDFLLVGVPLGDFFDNELTESFVS